MREMILHSAQLVSAVTNYCLNWAFTVTVLSQTLKTVGVGGGGTWQWGLDPRFYDCTSKEIWPRCISILNLL